MYDADGSYIGELLYMIRKFLGLAHCAACDITHGPRKEKPEFTRLKAHGWNVPFHNIHRDEMDHSLRHTIKGNLPAVAARTLEGRHVLLLGPKQLDNCCGSVATFENSVNDALADASLSTPPFPPQHPSLKLKVGQIQDIYISSDSEDSETSATLPELSGQYLAKGGCSVEGDRDQERGSKRRNLSTESLTICASNSVSVSNDSCAKKLRYNSPSDVTHDSDENDAVVPA